MIRMTGKYVVTMEDNTATNYKCANFDNLESATNTASVWFGASQVYADDAKHAVCINIFKRINAGSGGYDYDAIATFHRHPLED